MSAGPRGSLTDISRLAGTLINFHSRLLSLSLFASLAPRDTEVPPRSSVYNFRYVYAYGTKSTCSLRCRGGHVDHDDTVDDSCI